MQDQDNGISSRKSWGLLLLRVLVGWVFLSEGIQKFLYPAALGSGRFLKIGIPVPEISGPFVGAVEILFGVLVIAGLLIPWTAIPLLIDIATAIGNTKVPELMKDGFWKAMHEGRTDFSMLLGLIVIMLLGSGRYSFDGLRSRWRNPR